MYYSTDSNYEMCRGRPQGYVTKGRRNSSSIPSSRDVLVSLVKIQYDLVRITEDSRNLAAPMKKTLGSCGV